MTEQEIYKELEWDFIEEYGTLESDKIKQAFMDGAKHMRLILQSEIDRIRAEYKLKIQETQAEYAEYRKNLSNGVSDNPIETPTSRAYKTSWRIITDKVINKKKYSNAHALFACEEGHFILSSWSQIYDWWRNGNHTFTHYMGVPKISIGELQVVLRNEDEE